MKSPVHTAVISPTSQGDTSLKRFVECGPRGARISLKQLFFDQREQIDRNDRPPFRVALFVAIGDFCWEGKARFWLPGLVAGVGFEPTTFRL